MFIQEFDYGDIEIASDEDKLMRVDEDIYRRYFGNRKISSKKRIEKFLAGDILGYFLDRIKY